MRAQAQPQSARESAQEGQSLRHRLYLVALSLIVPGALMSIQVGFPEAGFMRSLTLTVTAGWFALLAGLALRRVSHRVVEWGTLTLGVLVFYVIFLNTLFQWERPQALTMLGAASLVPPWAFLALRDRWGLRVSLAFYLLILLTWVGFAVPAWLGGTYAGSHLPEAWRVYVFYFALSPIYIAITAAMAVLHRDQAERRLRAVTEYAYQDSLTGLPNRRAFQENLEQAVNSGGALALLNINGFTRLNNELGHGAGDQALRDLARRWRTHLRQEVHLSRMNGDELGLIFPGQTVERTLKLVEELVDVTTQPLTLNGALRNMSVRVGVVGFAGQEFTATAVNTAADVALSEARRQGRNVMLYDQTLADQAQRRRAVLSALPDAIAAGQFRLVYQPIFELRSGQLQSVEALLRWNPPITPTPTPDEFIALAEEARLINQIGDWVMRESLGQVKRWRAQGLNVPRVNVNVAPQELLQSGYARRVMNLLQELNLPPATLELELTERTVLEKEAVEELWRLRQAGVQVAIDDFGTGQSSLAWLHALPITCVKIDRRFTSMLGQDGGADRLSRTVLNLANSLNLEVVAEGIETPEQLDALRALSCPLGQGYFFSKPLSAPELAGLLRQKEP